MNLYPQEEIDRINKARETNDKLEEFFNDKRNDWNNTLEPLFKSISLNLSVPSNSKTILETQSLALSYRQQINEQINFFLNKRSKETSKLKKLKQEKFIFYATGSGLKTNMGEKAILIDGHISENDRTIELIDSFVEFQRYSLKNLEGLSYSIKNMIELINLLK